MNCWPGHATNIKMGMGHVGATSFYDLLIEGKNIIPQNVIYCLQN